MNFCAILIFSKQKNADSERRVLKRFARIKISSLINCDFSLRCKIAILQTFYIESVDVEDSEIFYAADELPVDFINEEWNAWRF